MNQTHLSNEQGAPRIGLTLALRDTYQPPQMSLNVSTSSEHGCQTATGNIEAARKPRPQFSLIESSLSVPEPIRTSSNLKALWESTLL